jgi:hypothetical protein
MKKNHASGLEATSETHPLTSLIAQDAINHFLSSLSFQGFQIVLSVHLVSPSGQLRNRLIVKLAGLGLPIEADRKKLPKNTKPTCQLILAVGLETARIVR